MKKLSFLIVLFLAFSVSLEASSKGASDYTEVELISEVNSIQPGRDFTVALRMKMSPSWHTYWKNPGDSGIPTTMRWELPEGFSAGDILWRYPEKYEMPPLTVYGYAGEIFLLTQITAPENITPGTTIDLKLRADWLECEKICIPANADLVMTLPVLETVPEINKTWAQVFASARAALPIQNSDTKIEVQGNADNFLIKLTLPPLNDTAVKDLYFYPYKDDLIDHAAPQLFSQESNRVELLVQRSALFKGVPAELEGVLVSSDGWRGPGSEKALFMNAKVLAVDGALQIKQARDAFTVWTALLFAFLGGLILNLMPCVFPVLSLKITHFVEEASHHPGRVWRQGAVFTMGVLLSFWILGLVLVLLKTAGHQIGWGFQLQSPIFLLILIFIFWLLALNLFGLYEIGAALTRVGGYTTHRHGLPGAFLSGILATVVATPCTAPFMGAALGFALTQPVAVALGVFTALGLGMALPYLLLSFFPPLLKSLPKPGPWMIRLKVVMGVLLTATVVWLTWVLFIQTGVRTITGAAIVALIFLGAAFFYGRFIQTGKMRAGPVLKLSLIVVMVAGVAGVMFLSRHEHGHDLFKEHKLYDLDWREYSPEFIEEMRRQKKTVFLDFTAAWCLSCQVNERLVFGSKEVRDAVEKLDVVLVKADWTHYDPRITQALAEFGRSSIPFYVLYIEEQEPIVLPEILTPNIFMKTLREQFPNEDI